MRGRQRVLPRILSHSTALLAGVLLAGLGTAVYAWTGPQGTPPNCTTGQTGCDAPINVGTGSQVKNGNLSVNALTATQNSAFYGRLGVGSSNAPSYALDVTGTARVYGSLSGTWGANQLIFGDDVNSTRYFMNTRGTNENNNADWRFYYYNTGSGSNAWQTILGSYPTALNAQTYSVGLHDDALLIDSSGNTFLGNAGNPIKLDSAWSNYTSYGAGGSTNRAEISNDTGSYKTLMIVGNKSGDGTTRTVSVWDQLTVNGDLIAAGAISASGGYYFPDGTLQTTAAGGGAPSGTLCGMASGHGACNIACNTYSSVATCNGQSVVSSCPAGYTLVSWVSGTGGTCTSGATVGTTPYCSRTCVKN